MHTPRQDVSTILAVNMRFMMALLLVALAWTPLTAMAQDATADEPLRPNIIFIMADDLGYGDLGCYGQSLIRTPNLDRMAEEGMRFRQFYAGSTVCAPSRSVLMTGQHMGHTFVRGNAGTDMSIQSLRVEDVTVADVLKSAGYQTALCGKWGLGDEMPDNTGLPHDQGFDFFYGYLNQVHAHNYYPEFLWRNREKESLNNEVQRSDSSYGGFTGGYATKRVDYSHDLIMEEALKFVESNADQPFFLYLPLTIPHANNEGTRETGNGQEVPEFGEYENESWSDAAKGQAAMITRMDRDIGRLIETLQELEIDDQTLIVFTSDNGPHDEGGHDTALFQPGGPLRGMKRDLYEGGIRVPCIVRWPGHVPQGTITDHMAYFGDLMATACELSGADPPDSIDSISFVPVITNAQDRIVEHEYLYWEFYERGGKQAVRMQQWKAIRMPMFTGEIQLFDLDADLGEATDVAAQHPDVVQRMIEIMEEAHVPNANWRPRGRLADDQPQPGDGRRRF